MTTETMNFGADVARLLEIVTHALYSNRDVFLRELISNAADACDRLRYEAIQKPELAKNHPGYTVRVYPDTAPLIRTLTVIDTGIGMSREEMIENLGTIAKSGTRAFVEQIKASGVSGPSMIGQFGVGFYSSFMAARKVDVISRKAGSDQTWVWSSRGEGNFEVAEATKEQAGLSSGGFIWHCRHSFSQRRLQRFSARRKSRTSRQDILKSYQSADLYRQRRHESHQLSLGLVDAS